MVFICVASVFSYQTAVGGGSASTDFGAIEEGVTTDADDDSNASPAQDPFSGPFGSQSSFGFSCQFGELNKSLPDLSAEHLSDESRQP